MIADGQGPSAHGGDNLLEEIRGYPRSFWILFFGQLLNAIGTSLVFPFLTVYLHDTLHANLATVGLVLLLQGAAQVVAVSVGGLLADAWGRLPTMYVSLGAGALATLALAFTRSPVDIVLLIVLRGGLLPLFQPAAQAFVADIVPHERLYPAFSLQRVASNAGIILGPMLGAFLLQGSFAILFLLSGIVMLAFGVIAVWALHGQEARGGESSTQSGLSLGLLRDPFLLVVTALFALVSLAYSQLYWVVPGYLTVFLHLPASRFGFLAAENAVLVVALQMPAVALSRSWRPELAIAVGAALYGLGFLLMAPLRTFVPFLVPVAVITCGEVLLSPSITSLVASRVRPEDRGKALGLVSLANRSGSAVGPLAGGSMLTFGGPWLLFPGTAAVAGVAALGYVWLARGRARAEAAADLPS